MKDAGRRRSDPTGHPSGAPCLVAGANARIASVIDIGWQRLQPQPAGDRTAVAVFLEPDALGIDLGRGQVLMPQRVLHVGQAPRLIAHQARIEAAEHQAWINAINRAALNLEAAPWAFDGEALRIASASTTGARYTVTPAGCECKAAEAGRPCWHRAAWRLLVKAVELVPPRAELTEAELEAIVEQLYG